MNFVLQPWQFLVVVLTGWLNRQQQLLIDFLLTEVHVLKETHGKRRIPWCAIIRPTGNPALQPGLEVHRPRRFRPVSSVMERYNPRHDPPALVSAAQGVGQLAPARSRPSSETQHPMPTAAGNGERMPVSAG